MASKRSNPGTEPEIVPFGEGNSGTELPTSEPASEALETPEPVSQTPVVGRRRTPEEISAEIEALENNVHIRRASGDVTVPSKREQRPDLTGYAQYTTLSDLSAALELFDYSNFASQGFSFEDDKRTFENTPMVIVHAETGSSNNFGPYALVWCLTADNTGRITGQHRFIDFGVGIRVQIEELNASGNLRFPMLIAKGLTSSEYDVPDPDTGRNTRATTWYLSE